MKLLTSALLLSGALNATMAGPPPRPMPGPPAPKNLAVHELAYAPGPVDNPLKGFVPFVPHDGDDLRQYPFSMEFDYFAMNELMLDWDKYDWTPFEKFLSSVASHGNQAVMRVYMVYPEKPSGVPSFLKKAGVKFRPVKDNNVEAPDYDDPRTLKAITSFIKAWGAKYDGDPRIGFITLGLVGLWGEWHFWPSPELMPNDISAAQIINSFDSSFKKTALEVRYPSVAGGEAVKRRMGFHDDSFAFRENENGTRKSVTLPISMGGFDWSFLQVTLNNAAENRWIDASIGGELRPDIQKDLFTDKARVDNFKDATELSHVSWMLNHKGIENFKAGDARMDKLVRGMGYDLTVQKAFFLSNQIPGRLHVGVQIANRGVARFYYPWKVMLGFKDHGGNVVKQFETNWDITQVQPLSIRAFPDWKSKNPYLNFGEARNFEVNMRYSGVKSGNYTLVMRVENPLQSPKAKTFRFSNVGQNADGWLELGEVNKTSVEAERK